MPALFLQILIPGSPGSSTAFFQERPLSPWTSQEAGRVDQLLLSEEQEKAGSPARLAGEATRRALPFNHLLIPLGLSDAISRVRGVTAPVLAAGDSLSTLML